MKAAVQKVVAVDDFAPDDLAAFFPELKTCGSNCTAKTSRKDAQ